MLASQDDTSETPLYTDLDATASEIRLASILTTDDDESAPVQVTLETVSLKDEPRYDTLSYCWGDPSITKSVVLGGRSFNVTTNLEAALRQLRQQWKQSGETESRVWIDAICINQANLSERGQQVSIMYDIYRQASIVHIWLGQGQSLQASRGFDVLHDLLDRVAASPTGRPDFNIWRDEQDRSEGIQALASLCRLNYWSRTWIVQEVSPKSFPDPVNLKLHLGSKIMSLPKWVDVHSIHGWMQLEQERLKNESRDDQRRLQRLQALDGDITHIQKTFYPMVIAAWGFMTRDILDSGDVAFARFLPTFLFELRKSEATDPRDKIYGILSLLPGAMRLVPDYRRSVADVYTDATVQLMEVTQSLFIIHQVCLSQRMTIEGAALPSWAPDYSTPPLMPSTFVDVFETFRAYADTNLVFKRLDQTTLAIAAFVADTVHETVSGSPTMANQSKIETIGAWKSLYEKSLQIQVRSSTDDQESKQTPWSTMTSFWRTACLTLKATGVSMNTPFEDEDDVELFERACQRLSVITAASEKQKQEDLDVLERVFKVMSEHDPFVTTSGRFGIVAKGTVKTNDNILLLGSAYCPFVVTRELGSAEVHTRTFKLCAPCYIDGIMNGEALEEEALKRFQDISRVQEVLDDITII